MLFSVLFVCKCVLLPGDNPIAVNKYHINFSIISEYYNLIGPPSYMRSVVDRIVVMQRITVVCVIEDSR